MREGSSARFFYHLLSPLLPAGTRAEAVLDTLPGKEPLIKLTDRPPNYEAPRGYLRTPITLNDDDFFVRYHLADIPQVGVANWKLSLGGPGTNGDSEIGFAELKKLPAFEIVAVCACAPGIAADYSSPTLPACNVAHGP